MKVYIGPYVNYIGPYQITGWLNRIGVPNDTCDRIGKWLSETWVNDVCEWVHERRDRRVKVVLHKYDTWNCEVTLAYIAVPLLKQFRAKTHSSPLVANDDVPPELRGPFRDHVVSSSAQGLNAPDEDPNFHERWKWVLGEIIWSLEQILDNGEEEVLTDHNNYTALKEYEARLQRGLTLFGKYFNHLWD